MNTLDTMTPAEKAEAVNEALREIDRKCFNDLMKQLRGGS